MATTTIQIGSLDNGRAMTLDEFLDADAEEGYRYELARGVLEVTNVPNEEPHGDVVCNLFRAIARYEVRNPGLIRRWGGGSEFRLVIPKMISGRNPDAAIVLKRTPKDARGRRHPALAIEVVSQGGETRDYETKREEYLLYGLLEYWIVDPQAKKVTVLNATKLSRNLLAQQLFTEFSAGLGHQRILFRTALLHPRLVPAFS